VAPRPPGGNFRPPQSSQVHTTPGPRPQCAPVSAPASFPTVAQGSQVHASPAASVATPSTDQASAPLAPFPLAVQGEGITDFKEKSEKKSWEVEFSISVPDDVREESDGMKDVEEHLVPASVQSSQECEEEEISSGFSGPGVERANRHLENK
ncbi:hypothetical protein U1Q18_007535, partial [Sarracenia purpurea var. burkii]